MGPGIRNCMTVVCTESVMLLPKAVSDEVTRPISYWQPLTRITVLPNTGISGCTPYGEIHSPVSLLHHWLLALR